MKQGSKHCIPPHPHITVNAAISQLLTCSLILFFLSFSQWLEYCLFLMWRRRRRPRWFLVWSRMVFYSPDTRAQTLDSGGDAKTFSLLSGSSRPRIWISRPSRMLLLSCFTQWMVCTKDVAWCGFDGERDEDPLLVALLFLLALLLAVLVFCNGSQGISQGGAKGTIKCLKLFFKNAAHLNLFLIFSKF